MKIRDDLPTAEWRHCPGDQNPADLPSRGMILDSDERVQKWLYGPEFLVKSEEVWPKSPNNGKESESLTCELSTNHSFVVSSVKKNQINVIDIRRFNCINKLFRVTSYVLRFMKNLKTCAKDRVANSKELTSEEIMNAKRMWILNEQKSIINDKKRFYIIV